jgi:hypothetical protein
MLVGVLATGVGSGGTLGGFATGVGSGGTLGGFATGVGFDDTRYHQIIIRR